MIGFNRRLSINYSVHQLAATMIWGVAALLLSVGGEAVAAILAQYNLEEPATRNVAVTSDDNDAIPITGLTVSNLTNNSAGFGTDDGSSLETGNSADGFAYNAAGGSLPTTAGSGYFSFTLTSDVNTEINLDSLTMAMGIYRTGSSGSLTLSFSVLWSEDDYAAAIGTLSTGSLSPGVDVPVVFNLFSLDLSAVTGSQGITDSVTFRLYPFEPSNSTSFSKFGALDTVTVTGEVEVIPEPASAALCLAGLTLIAHRRR